ncbi:phage tail protein [Zymobacter palmae]|uniref:Phage-related tail fibre n=1 Tax=Zymobacter palmae TaxID=33074 RepID=A0A348HI80_9GAMM|nr:phage tail protein [Zymobacter palmae]BBG31332.1 phage-related tail fibre [Zymobacter palmae]
MASFYTILTSVGQAKVANAVALGQKVNLSTLAVGDANGVTPQPDASAKALVHERRRAPLNRVEVDKDNPNFIVCEQVLPPEVGGWEIREIGVFDDEGNLIAYGNYPPTYKPLLNEGTSRTQTVRMVMQVSDTAAVTLKVDPSVVLATRQYVDDAAKASAEALKKVDESVQVNANGLKEAKQSIQQNAEHLKKVTEGLGAAASMGHNAEALDGVTADHNQTADTAQLVELRDRVGTLKEGARREVSGRGNLITTNYLKEHYYSSYTSVTFTTANDYVMRSVSGTEFKVPVAGTYMIIGHVRAWAGGDVTGAATYWMAAYMKNGEQVTKGAVGTNSSAGNRDADAPIVDVSYFNAGDVVTAGFLHTQGRPWDQIYLYSTLVMLRIGD